MSLRPRRSFLDLGRRERQIIEVLFRRGAASVGEVCAEIGQPPSYSTVRALLGKLEAKGVVRHRQEGRRYIYSTTLRRDQQGESLLRRIVRSLFGGSTRQAVTALLDLEGDALSEADLSELAALIASKRRSTR
jgi:BlaI family transcriptional regulator, penicillinase repressor